MVSKNQAKFIKSLKIKKFRVKEGCFLIEGSKNVLELINSDFKIKWLIGTKAFLSNQQKLLSKVSSDIILEASANELSDLGTFKTNHDCLAVADMKMNFISQIDEKEHLIVLDGVGDPGNLGTIIRTLDWFGHKNIVCSHSCADLYNPKVINSTMGSFSRVNVHYTDLLQFLKDNKKYKVVGADMNGTDIKLLDKTKPIIIVMGSESHGISLDVQQFLTEKVTISGEGGTESLNVAMATGIIAYQLALT